MAMGNEEATIIVFMTEGSLPTAKACRKNIAFLYLLARLRGEALHRIAGFTRAGIAFLRDASGHELESSGLEDQVTLRFAIYLPVFLIALLAIALVDALLSVTRREIERVM
ncbi:hypothetical protein BDP67DRAFT_580948 [Colletotrichum lupini]|nr:hypothetical protein BDP67DRAFT_580948 [Colletotrichum lupini]